MPYCVPLPEKGIRRLVSSLQRKNYFMENYYGNMLCYQLDYPLVDLHLIFEISSSQKSSSKTKLVNQRLQKSSADQQGLHSKRGLIKMYLCAVHALKGDHCVTAGCCCEPLKSVNLQYNTLVCWDDGPNESSTKRLMFQVSFIMISCKILCKKPFHSFYHFFIKLQK